ncbi:MAG: ATP-binding protein, partial [Sulfolobaceae archaeon]
LDIIFKKVYINKNDYISKIINKAQNLRIILANDPSNEKAKRELEIIEAILGKINEGELPFKYSIFFIITEKNEQEVHSSISVLKKALEGIGLKARSATVDEILSILQLNPSSKRQKIAISSQLPFLTPFSIPKSPRFEFINDGVILGKNIESNVDILWNFNNSQNQHILVIGPTGSGKTEFLLSLAVKMSILFDIKVVLFDIKGDLKLRLKKRNIPFKNLSPLLYRLDLLNTNNIFPEIRALQIERIIYNSFKIDKIQSSILYRAIREVVSENNNKKIVKWDDVYYKLKEYLEDYELLSYFGRIINIIKITENGISNIIDSLDDNINIIDLTLIKNEELRRFIIYSIITELYNKYSKSVDENLRLMIVVDEAWTVLKSEDDDYPIIADLVKRGRGHGISIAMASQNIEDLGELANIYLDNVGLLVVMNNGDKKFWQEIRRFVNINEEEIERELSFLQRGEALIRFLGDPRPLIIKTELIN